MSEDQLHVFSESNAEQRLTDQIEVYHGLQRRAQSLLRLIVAILAVTVTLISAGLSGFLKTDFSIKSFEYYYSQTVPAAASGGDTLTALLAVYTIGILFIFASVFFAISGINSIISVTEYGIKPYMPGYVAEDVKMIPVDSQATGAKLYCIEINSKIISKMHAKSMESYKYFGLTIMLLVVGITSVASAHFADIELAEYIVSVLFLISLSILVMKPVTYFLNIRTSAAMERLEKIDVGMSKITKFVLNTASFMFISIISGLILYLFEYLTQPLIWFASSMVFVLLFIGALIDAERKQREIKLLDFLPKLGNGAEETDSSWVTSDNKKVGHLVPNEETTVSEVSEYSGKDMVRIGSLVEEDDDQTNYNVDLSEPILWRALEELNADFESLSETSSESRDPD